MSQSNTSASGVGLGGLLFVLFLYLKLTDQVDWAWVWVAAPLWIPLGLSAVIMLVALTIYATTYRKK